MWWARVKIMASIKKNYPKQFLNLNSKSINRYYNKRNKESKISKDYLSQ